MRRLYTPRTGRRLQVWALAGLLALILAAPTGCGPQEEKTEPEEEQYPEMAPNPDEMVADAVRQLRVLEVIPAGVPLEFLMWPQHRQQLIQFVNNWKRETLAQPEGEQALAQLRDKLETLMRKGREEKNAALVLLTIDLLRELGSEMAVLDSFEQWAEAENNKPLVTVRGMREDPVPDSDPPRNRTVAILQVHDPKTGAAENVSVEEGDEFYGLRLEKILGRYRGVRLRYLETGETFDVMR